MWQSWPPMATEVPLARAAKAATSVAGGHTSRSADGAADAPAIMASSSESEPVSPFIFQFPAISGRVALAI